MASLAALAYERPDYAMPAFVPGAPSFSAKALSHPLIDRSRVVPNDLTLDGAGSVLLLSGSNMSGKSTLLRSVGLSVVMARAGAPVAAQSLSLSDFDLLTSVRLVDSLAAGTSHFYAEILRLKAIVDRAGQDRPVLYLLDEVLHGTNSKERFLGAMAVIRWLAEKSAMGIVTTHDLALAEIASKLPAGKARNLHFSDDIEKKELSFDYKLRDGPIRSTNALRLMRAVGIDLDFEEAPKASTQGR
jgi:DNA mismatch repair ATPase MutS